MRRSLILLFGASVALMFAGSAVGGTLAFDDNAYNDEVGMVSGDGNPYWRGSVLYFGGILGGSWEINADVEYAVYAPGMFGTSLALGEPTDPSNGEDWVYAYQIFNNASDPLATLNAFSVGLDGDEWPRFIGFLDGPGVNPVNSYFSPALPDPPVTAKWTLSLPSNGGIGDIMFFTAPGGPETDYASLQNGLACTRNLPSPMVPEPATLQLLLFAVAMLALCRGVRVSRV